VPSRKPALGFIFATLLLDILGLGLIIPILPRLIEEFHQGDASAAAHTVGILTALYGLMQFLFAPLLGSLSDRFGRRPVILISLFGSGLDLLLLAFAPTLGWFYLGRILAGITGANFAAATAYIADISPPEKRAANFGMVGAAFGLGFILGPALGGILGDIGLRMPFLVASGLTFINCLYGLFVLPESLSTENRRPFNWGRSNPAGALLNLKRHPAAAGLAGVTFLSQLAHQSLPSTWVLYTSHRYGWSVGETGWSLALVGLCAAVVQGGLTRFVVKRFGEKRSALAGLSVAVLSYLGYGLATEGWMIYALIVFASLGGIAGPSIQAMISQGAGADEQGGVQGTLGSLGSLAGIIGPPITAALFAWFISPSAPFQAPGAAFLFSSLLSCIAFAVAFSVLQKPKTPR